MAVFKVETKNKVDIDKKPRVYFTCHPNDFERCFRKLADDIFKTHDCAIYYTEDMTETVANDEKDVDLGRNNLFVIPVTFQLLTTPNRAMDEDVPYALKEHIPVLPIMMESGIDSLYSQKFGELQYLNPYSTDATEISYEEKLKKHLESVLISDETASRVRAAFDAYIFLSYRKKDRKYANELMRLIHRIPECRDIAIWFDEFLTPGESFKDGINKILSDSKLFTLLVTPNLLEEPNGQPNFVMAEEYPAAMQSGINVLPVEMEQTEKDALDAKYKDIPVCVDPHNEGELKHRLTQTLFNIVRTENDEDPAHNFLIGLAYLEGIDVEVNRERGLQLITKAAEADIPEAMSMLFKLYASGNGVRMNFKEAKTWALRLAQFYQNEYGTDHPDTIEAMQNVALMHHTLGEYDTALELNETLHAIAGRVFGENHPKAMIPLAGCVTMYYEMGKYTKALEQGERVQALCQTHLGEEHPLTIEAMRTMVSIQLKLGKYQDALERCNKVLEMYRKLTGDTAVETLIAKNDLAAIYTELEDLKEANRILTEIYPLCEKELGSNHPLTLVVLGNLGDNYSACGDGEKALEIATKVLEKRQKLYGEKHPSTLVALSNAAQAFEDIKEFETAKKLHEAAYDLRCEVLGAEHPDVALSLARLASAYAGLRDYKNALSNAEKAYALSRKVLGESHTQTTKNRDDLAYFHSEFGEYRRACELIDISYRISCERYGKAHQKTIRVAHSLSLKYHNLKEDAKALALLTDLYASVCETLGERDLLTLKPLEDLAFLYVETDNLSKAMELWQHAYDVRANAPDTEASELEWIQQKMDSHKRWAALKTSWKEENCCQYCGGQFTGLFKKKCKQCGRLKDY